MVKQVINIGASPNDHTGEGLRTAFSKTNSNFDELYIHANSITNPHNVTASQVGALALTGGTLTGPLTLFAGNSTTASLTLPAGTILANAIANSVEWDGSKLYLTRTGNVRKTVAFDDVFVGDSGSGGQKGLVPSPQSGDALKFLRGDGTWAPPLSNGAITNSFLTAMPNYTLKGRYSAGSGTPEDLTPAQVRTILDLSNLYVTANGNQVIAGDKVFTGNVTITPSSGTDVDQIFTTTLALTLTDQWQDTGINATILATGTYFVQLYISSSTAVGGGITNEYYSGTMSWFASDTDDTEEDEIVLHRAGHKTGSNRLYLKTVRTLTANINDLKLQISSLHNDTGSTTIQFKFRRMI